MRQYERHELIEAALYCTPHGFNKQNIEFRENILRLSSKN